MSLALAMIQACTEHEFWVVLSDRFPETLDPIRKTFAGLLPQERVKVFSVPANTSESGPENAWLCRAAEYVREDFIARLKPDVVHVSSLFEGLGDDAVTSIGAFRGDYLTVVTAYDLIPLIRKDVYLPDQSMRLWYYRKLQMLKNSDLVLAISESARQEVVSALQLAPSRAINISSAVDDMFKPSSQASNEKTALMARFGLTRPFVMYTGGLDPRKNIDGLLTAYALLPQQLRSTHQLAIVCSVKDEQKARLYQIAAGFGLHKDEVVFTGFVPDQDLVALYNACKLFVFPSVHEGFGLPALEAMSCGVAVIGSNKSSIPEVIGRDDALFDPTEPGAIAAKIERGLTDDRYRASLAAHGLIQATKFSWSASARRALDAIELEVAQRAKKPRTDGGGIEDRPYAARPRMAYVSPLPPDKSGIADYSAELLPELGRFYDIEVISTQSDVVDPWILANFPIRTVKWFDENAHRYERVLYHFGNSDFHHHMFGLLQRHPGVVVLHDFFLSGILNHLDFDPGEFHGGFGRALYMSHGYAALLDERDGGRENAVAKYPLNLQVLDDALGVIVHSRFSFALADKWYGPGKSAEWKYIPHLRALPSAADRSMVRKTLGMHEDDFVICSFGILNPAKLNKPLIQAVLDAFKDSGKRIRLIFVGQNHGGVYGQEIIRAVADSGWDDRIKITGFASQSIYRDYLTAADAAVQLRTSSRGETSGTILDCLAYGIPTIINAHGSAADIPADVTIKLDDEFSIPDLRDALRRIRADSNLRAELRKRSVEYIRTAHHPEAMGAQYYSAIEHFFKNSNEMKPLFDALSQIGVKSRPTDGDLAQTARSILRNRPVKLTPQLFVDVTEMKNAESLECVRKMLGRNWITFRVEPFYVGRNGQAVYARKLTAEMLGLFPSMKDATIEFKENDFVLTFNESSGALLKTDCRNAKCVEIIWSTLDESYSSDGNRIYAVNSDDAVDKIGAFVASQVTQQA